MSAVAPKTSLSLLSLAGVEPYQEQNSFFESF